LSVTAFTISFQPAGDGAARLQLPSAAATSAPDDLRSSITLAVEAAFADDQLDRLEIPVREPDNGLRWAVIRSGFRLEGRRRRAGRDDDGRPVDELIFGRLRSDVIGGADGFSAVANTITPRKRLIAHVLMRDSAGRILLCETTFKTDWELPGGIVERGESPRLGAIREIREELGVDREIGTLLAVDWMPPYLGWDDALELIFDGGSVTEDELADYQLDPREIVAVNLIELADAEPHLTPLSFRRLTAITTADPEQTLVLENGSPL
jgi:8-oxo-dGTP pyrophosphatase MutT (NUDIX family)